MSSKKTRRRSSILAGIDPANLIESPTMVNPVSSRRRSLRLRRKSVIPHPTEDFCHSDLCSSEPENIPPVSVTEEPFALTNCLVEAQNSPSAVNYEHFVPPTSATALSAIPASSPSSIPDWLKPKYSPPKPTGLESLREDSTLAHKRRRPLTENTLRFQVFTGQTMDEACLPKYPGAAPLDPDMVMKLTQRRVRLRQQKAKRMGFKGVTISQRTDRRMSALLDMLSHSPSSPET